MRVARQAQLYQGLGLSLADLIAEGNLALVRASLSFNPEGKSTFRSSVRHHVQRAIYRALKEQRDTFPPAGRAWRINRSSGMKRAGSEKGPREDLPNKKQPTGSAQGQRKRTPMPKALPEERNAAYSLWSHQHNGQKQEHRGARHNRPYAASAEDVVLQQELHEQLHRWLYALSEREREAITCYYGLGKYVEQHTQGEVAHILGIASTTVRYHLNNALRKLRGMAVCSCFPALAMRVEGGLFDNMVSPADGLPSTPVHQPVQSRNASISSSARQQHKGKQKRLRTKQNSLVHPPAGWPLDDAAEQGTRGSTARTAPLDPTPAVYDVPVASERVMYSWLVRMLTGDSWFGRSMHPYLFDQSAALIKLPGEITQRARSAPVDD